MGDNEELTSEAKSRLDMDSLLFKPKSLEEIKDECLVALDTNVLLNWAQHTGNGWKTILAILCRLRETDRLLIPAQVVIEYEQSIQVLLSNLWGIFANLKGQLERPDNDTIARLERFLPPETYAPIEEALNTVVEDSPPLTPLKKAIGNAKSILAEALERPLTFKPWIEKLFRECVWDPFAESRIEELEKQAKQRHDRDIPPGLSDKDKEDNAAGDVIIWFEIIDKCRTEKRDCAFVTRDKGFFLKDYLCVDRRLLREFYDKTEGQMVRIITPSQWFDAFKGPEEQISEKTREELDETPVPTPPSTPPPFSPERALVWGLSDALVQRVEADFVYGNFGVSRIEWRRKRKHNWEASQVPSYFAVSPLLFVRKGYEEGRWRFHLAHDSGSWAKYEQADPIGYHPAGTYTCVEEHDPNLWFPGAITLY